MSFLFSPFIYDLLYFDFNLSFFISFGLPLPRTSIYTRDFGVELIFCQTKLDLNSHCICQRKSEVGKKSGCFPRTDNIKMANGRILWNLSDKWQDITEFVKIHGHVTGNMLSCQNRSGRDVS